MPRRLRSRVSTTRRWEVYCEAHGILESSRAYSMAQKARERHREEHPECFTTPSMLLDPPIQPEDNPEDNKE